MSRRLLDAIESAGELTTDELLARVDGDAKQQKRAITQLRERLLLHGRQAHTESGHHATILESWQHFADRRALEPSSEGEGRQQLEQALAPWPSALGMLPWRRWPSR